jgi:transcriptional regulator with XRE-family HTH domain
MTKSPNPIDRHVGTRLRMRRVQVGLSQEKLGDALGITFQQVQKYEKGTNRIGASRLQLAAKVLNVPVNFFFEGTDAATDLQSELTDAAPGESVASFARTSEGVQLISAFLQIKEAKLRKKIIDLIGAMATEAKD